jgi:flagellar hook-length control protein FliK
MQQVAGATRRPVDKVKAADDARRRTRDNGETGESPRRDASAAPDKSNNSAIANAVRADIGSVAANAKPTGDEPTRRSAKPAGAKSDALLHPLGRPQRMHGGVGRAASAENKNLPHVDAARFVGRVAKAIQTANERGGALQLRLSPPELGTLRLELTVHNGVMSALLEAESPVARQVLLDHLPMLRDRLAEQNIRLERFDVEVRQDGSGGQPDPRASQQDQRQQQPFQHTTPRRDSTPRAVGEDTSRDIVPVPMRTTTSGINVMA